MELLEWRDEFATGISGVDFEHEELITSINEFYSKLAEHSDKDTLVDILNNIYGAIYSHFALEEKLMEKYGYDAYEEHRDDHAKLLDDIQDITAALETTDEYDEQLLRKKLSDWFAIHFKTHDARLHRLEQLIASKKDKNGGVFSFLKKPAGKTTDKK